MDRIIAGPMSPCINICSLDGRGYCRGCYRSLEEIAGWPRMSPAERERVLQETERRRREQGGAARG